MSNDYPTPFSSFVLLSTDLMIKNLVEMGMGGWMADFGEYLPVDAVYHTGADPVQMHNQYPVLWAKLNYDVLKGTNRLGEIMFFMRAGGTGTLTFNYFLGTGRYYCLQHHLYNIITILQEAVNIPL